MLSQLAELTIGNEIRAKETPTAQYYLSSTTEQPLDEQIIGDTGDGHDDGSDGTIDETDSACSDVSSDSAIFNLTSSVLSSAALFSSGRGSVVAPTCSSATSSLSVSTSDPLALYVGDLNPAVSESTLYDYFSGYGPISSIHVCRDAQTQKSLCYAYVNFVSQHNGVRAMEELNYTNILGRPCRIMKVVKDIQQHKAKGGNIYIRNLHPSIDTRALYDFFSAFGQIISCKLAYDDNGKSQCRGYVQFDTRESATEAVAQINGKYVLGSLVHVDYYLSKEERQKLFNHAQSLFVKGLPGDTTEQEMFDIFGVYGTVASVYLPCDSINDGHRLGWGYVNYEIERDAYIALHFTKKCIFRGFNLAVTRSQPKAKESSPKKPSWLKLVVGLSNIPANINEDDLAREIKTTVGIERITKVDIFVKTGEAVVELSSQQDVKQVVYNFHLRTLGNSRIVVEPFERLAVKTQDERSPMYLFNRYALPVAIALPMPRVTSISSGAPLQLLGMVMGHPMVQGNREMYERVVKELIKVHGEENLASLLKLPFATVYNMIEMVARQNTRRTPRGSTKIRRTQHGDWFQNTK
jgi:polyadenylate-binding protein